MRHNSLLWQSMHKWLALLVGLQLTLWLVTGLAFNLLDESQLDGNHYRQAPHQLKGPLSDKHASSSAILASPNTLLTQGREHPIYQIRLSNILQRPVYIVTDSVGDTYLWADSLNPVVLTPDDISMLAKQSYRGPGTLSTPHLMPATFTRFGAHAPIYELVSDDELDTKVYVDGRSGEVVGHLNQQSELNDWLFMLHFMDYNAQDGLSFNHFWTRIIALMGILLGLSGIVTLYAKLSQGAMRFPWHRHRAPSNINLFSPEMAPLAQFEHNQDTLLESINAQRLLIRTSCGGGGRCGLCKVRFIDNVPPANVYEIDKLSPQELDSGMRLSCQQTSAPANITLSTRAQWRFWQKSHTQP